VGTDLGGFDDGMYSVGTESNGTWTWTVATHVSHNRPFTGVSCASASACVAVGNFSGLIYFSSGTMSLGTWTWTSATTLPLEGDGELTSVSCTSSSTCVAVGQDGGGQPDFVSGTEAGSTWTWGDVSVVAINSSAIYGTFSSVSCVTSTQCVAAGNQVSNGTYAMTSIGYESSGTWHWAIANEVVSASSSQGQFAGVDCLSATTCLAVGESGGQAVYDAWSTASATVTSAPTRPIVTSGHGSASISWRPPSDSGGSVITGYTVTEVDTAASSTVQDVCPLADNSAAVSCTVDGLTDFDTYTFTVAAINPVGTSAFSAPSAAVSPSANVPFPPFIGTASVSNGVALLNWTAGATGGSPITGYTILAIDLLNSTVIVNACPTSDTSTTTNCTITGLTNGHEYVFGVAGINALGLGDFSGASNLL